MVSYENILEKVRQAKIEGVDIVYLEDPEYTETLNGLLKVVEPIKFTSECPARPKDTFVFHGVEFIKQE